MQLDVSLDGRNDATTCDKGLNETMGACIEWFLLHTQGYFNVIDPHCPSAKNQNFAMILLSNANSSQQMFLSVMFNLVSFNKNWLENL